jgi:DNA polymerase-3 subunit epsilon
MERQIILDTETTGLAPEEGHRIIEIGCIEVVGRRPSGRKFHRYLNPEREIDAGAADVHGLTLETLRECPRFQDIALEFVDFVRGAELVIHNAPFDVGFLNAELARLGDAWGRLEDYCRVCDTLALARERHPGQRNSLDALCKRYEIDNAHRNLHGALLDAELLMDVYLALTGGQHALALAAVPTRSNPHRITSSAHASSDRTPRVLRATLAEREAHRARLEQIARASGGRLVWRAPEE